MNISLRETEPVKDRNSMGWLGDHPHFHFLNIFKIMGNSRMFGVSLMIVSIFFGLSDMLMIFI
jgi:hypothetical protein